MKQPNKIFQILFKKLDLNIQISRRNRPVRNKLIDNIISNDIDVIFDVGANSGQFAQQLRWQGYQGKIVSFEPLFTAYKKLEYNSRNDAKWIVINKAIGSEEKTAEINVSENSWSSSFLPLEDGIVAIEPGTRYSKIQIASVIPLDSVFESYTSMYDKIFLKIDVQGYEYNVLEGAKLALGRASGILMEASLTHHYKGEWLFHEAVAYLVERKFSLFDLAEGFRSTINGQLIQVDALFWRNK